MSECKESPFDSQYTSKSTTTEKAFSDKRKPEELVLEIKKYGISKPRREFIRATIINDK